MRIREREHPHLKAYRVRSRLIRPHDGMVRRRVEAISFAVASRAQEIVNRNRRNPAIQSLNAEVILVGGEGPLDVKPCDGA